MMIMNMSCYELDGTHSDILTLKWDYVHLFPFMTSCFLESVSRSRDVFFV